MTGPPGKLGIGPAGAVWMGPELDRAGPRTSGPLVRWSCGTLVQEVHAVSRAFGTCQGFSVEVIGSYEA